MEESQGTTLLHHLPRDVIIEILSVLPVKSLLTLKCVSKSFYSVISDEDFVRAHFLKSSKDPSFAHLKLAASKECWPVPRFSSYNTGHSIDLADLFRAKRRCTSFRLLVERLAIEIDFSKGDAKRTTRRWSNTVRSSNGLLCYFLSEKDLILRNPSTRRYKKLPPPFCCFGKKGKVDGDISVYSCGFGYVESTKDYKVVAFSRPQEIDGSELCTVKMYSLKTDSWRTVNENYQVGKASMNLTARHISGVLYWLRISRGLRWEIVSFNLEKEEFGIPIRQPSEFSREKLRYRPRQLGVFNGRYLCVLFVSKILGHTDLWVLTKPQSWTRIPILPKARVKMDSLRFGVCTDGAIYREFEPESTLFYYMPKEMRKRNLKIIDLDIFNGVCAHVESLVSLGSNSFSEECGQVNYGGVIDLESENTSYEDYDDDGQGKD